MSLAYDIVVIGAGHNGLSAATLLARRGRKVLVLEARETVGGLAAGEEFHPGYRHAGILPDTGEVRPFAIQLLGLARHGLTRREPAAMLTPATNGPGIVLEGRHGERAVEGLSDRDAARLDAYRRFLARVAPIAARLTDRPPPDLVATGAGDLFRLGMAGLALRRLGKRDMMEVLRFAPMPVADWLGEWFESEILKASLAAPALLSTTVGPRAPGGSANLLLSAARTAGPIAGGGRALVAALEGAARAAGVEIRTGATVERVLLQDRRVTGVELAGAKPVSTRRVAASCDPKQLFLDLLPPAALDPRLESEILNFRSRGTTAKIHLALSAYPTFSCRPGRVFEHVRTGETLDEIERAADAIKYRRFSERPILDVRFPSVEDPTLAPEGHHVASILVGYAPFELEGGWTAERRDELRRSVLDVLEGYAPGIGSLVVGSEVLTPADLASRYRLTDGHLFHGEHAIDQLALRPVADCAGYRTPFEGLYLCGSGSHPGGGLTCAPGALAAQVIP